MHKNFILASSSKSRLHMLKSVGLKFMQTPPNCDEEKIKKKLDKKNPKNFVKKLSFEKSKSISCQKKYRNKLVVGCDTVVVINNKIFDKAKNMKEAAEKIRQMSGKEHKIISGISITKNGKLLWQDHETTKVIIRKLKEKQISNYLKKTGKQILNSVGCYQIEAAGPIIIENINGDFFNVMGLPVFKLLKYIYNK